MADTGALLGLARDAQQAVDMALAARYVAERALLPAVIAMDAPETAWAPSSVLLPDAALVREALGSPDDQLESPTVEQSLTLGDKRRRVPRWFDPDRPAAHGMQQSGRDLAVALAGQRAFAAEPVSRLLDEALEAVSRLTGRKLERVTQHRMDGAEYVFVAQGAAIHAAIAVADYLRNEKKEKVGVLGIDWLRPLAAAAIEEALRHAQAVTVLERTGDALAGGGPLLREIRAAIGDTGPKLLHATYGLGGQPLSNADLLALFENMRLPTGARTDVALGVSMPKASTAHPRRQALAQRLLAEYPELARSTLAIDAPLDLRPTSAKTVALWARHSESPAPVLDALASAVSKVVGQHVRSRTSTVEQGTWMAQVTAAGEAFSDLASVVWHDVAVVATPELPAAINPAAEVAKGGALLLASPLSEAELWRELPESWQRSIDDRELRVFVLDGSVSDLVNWVPWLLGAPEMPEGDLKRLTDVDPRVHANPVPPLAVRRFSRTRSTYDNLPRFWGELALPRLEQGVAETSPDPYLSLAAVPPSTSSLFEVAVHRNRIPLVDIERCVGCGACWTACPDSAIVPGIIGTEALLNAAADIATPPGAERNPIADKVRRAHKQLAARVDGALAKQKATKLDGALLSESFSWLLEQMKVSAEERPEYEKVFKATLAQVKKLPYAATEPFFHRPHSEQKGSGELVALAVSPAACQGCGGCSAVCPEDAITVGERNEDNVISAGAGFTIWEQLPDPSGESIARAGRSEAVGNMAAVMTSRHTLLAVTGGGGHEPGSGARVGARLVAAVTELEQQRRTVQRVGALRDLSQRCRSAIRDALAGAVPSEDLAALDRALESTPDRSGNVGALVEKLGALGAKSTVDSESAERLVKLARLVDEELALLETGADGMGRARFGLVIAGEPLGEWAAEFPRNPFAVPTVVDLSSEALDLSMGLAESLLDRHAAEVRLARRTELWLSNPGNAVLEEPAVERLGWQDLSDEEIAACPPVVVLAGPEIFGAASQAGLSRVLASRFPVKVVVLDGRERWIGATDPLLPYVMQRRALVMSSTIAHREHLFAGVSRALAQTGPALIHVYAPSPNRHGFDSADTVARARAAVDCRVHPLFVWDPAEDGVFGTRFRLEGNPSVTEPWAKDAEGTLRTPAHFALGETRFASHFVAPEGDTLSIEEWARAGRDERAKAMPMVKQGDVECVLDRDLADAVLERLSTWRTLQELAGVVTPFTAKVKADADRDVAAAHQQEIEKIRAEYEAKLAAQKATQLDEATARLGQRLIELAGYAPARRGDGQA